MTNPFDRALEEHALWAAAHEVALGDGHPGSSAYRAAWVEFRREICSLDDLRRVRRRVALERDVIVRDVLSAAVAYAMWVDGTAMATAQLLTRGSHALRLMAYQGFSQEFADFFQIVDDATTSCGAALQRGEPVLVSDIPQSPVFAGTLGLNVILRAGCRAVASVPITSPNGRVLAMLSTHHQHATDWTSDRLVALRDLSRSAGHLLYHLLDEPGRLQATPV